MSMDTAGGEPGTGSGVGGVGSTGSGIGGGSGNDTAGHDSGRSDVAGHGFGVDIGYEGSDAEGGRGAFGLDVSIGVFGELDRSVTLGEVSDLVDSFSFGIESEVFGAISGRTAFDKTLGLMMGNPYAQAREIFKMAMTLMSLFAPFEMSLVLDISEELVSRIPIEPTVSVPEYVDIMFEVWERAENSLDAGGGEYRQVIKLVDGMFQTTMGGAITFVDVLDILEPVDTLAKPVYRRRSNIIGTGRIGLTIE